MTPYGPLRELLAEALTPLRARQLAEMVDGLWLREVSQIVPQLAEWLPDLPAPILTRPEQAQNRMLEAISQMLLALEQVSPHLLVLDDAQWADDSTLDLLVQLAPRLRERRMLMLLGYRGEETHTRPELWETLRALDQAAGRARLSLERLNDDGSATTYQYDPAIATDAAGNAYAAWRDYRAVSSGEVYFATRPAGGTWSAVEKVSDDTNAATQVTPAIAVDEQGNVYATWKDYRDNSSNRDVYFAYRPAGGVWSANVRVNDVLGSHGSATLDPPDVAAGSNGRAYVIWNDVRNGAKDIYAGTIAVGVLVSGTGQLPASASLQTRLDADPPSSESLTLWPGQVVSDSLVLDIPAGRHTLTAELHDRQGQLLDSDALERVLNPNGEAIRPEIEILEVTTDSASRQLAGAAAAGNLTVTVTLANHGPGGAVVVGAQLFDAPQQWVITATGYLTQTFAFSLSLPADLPQGAYTGRVVVGDQSQAFDVDLSGVDLALALALDATAYLPGEPVELTATVTDLGGDYHLSLRTLDAEEFVTVTVPAGGALVHTFVFTATEAERASVSLSFLPQPGEAAQRVITIDSLAVNVVDPSPGATLTFDQAVYHPGDVVTLDVSVVGERRSVAVIGPLELQLYMDDPLLWWAPQNEAGQVVTGTHTVPVTLPPQMKTGRYTFLLLVEGNEVPYLIDVQGWSVLADRLTLDRVRYDRQDTLNASVEFYNEGATPIDDLFLYAAILPPDGGSPLPFSPEVSQTVTLQPGLNRLTFSGAFETQAVGAHRLVVDLRPQAETWRLAAASAQFDVGWAQLVELTTDRGNYAPGEPGLGRLDVYGLGPTHLVVTTSVGTTVLDTMLDLDGFEALSFSIPTASEGDYWLYAQSTDRDGNTDHLVGAYAMPPPRDTTPPEIQFTNLSATTFITTTAPTLTLTIEGVATDDSGSATVLLDGQRIEPGGGGAFTAEVEVRQGRNRLWAVAVDDAGNVSYSPEAEVTLMPERSFSLGADRVAVGAGETIVLRAQLGNSGVLSDTSLALSLPAALVADVTATASRGGTPAVTTLDPDVYGVLWHGDLAANNPVEVVVTARAVAPGTVPVQATANWGFDLSDSAQVEVVVSTEPPSMFMIIDSKSDSDL